MLLTKPGYFQFKVYGPDKNRQEMQEKNELPINIIKEQIAQKFMPGAKKLYVFRSPTGSGKSSMFMNQLLKLCNGKKIFCTQPTRPLCIDLMRTLPKNYPDMIPGITIGYKIMGDELVANFPQSVTFMTTQTMTNYIKLDKLDDVFSCKFIAVDEVHSMNEQMIEMLYFIKFFLSKYNDDPRCPLFICMSATINIEKFTKYFDMAGNLKWYDIGYLRPAPMRFGREEFYFHKSQSSVIERIGEAMEFVSQYYKEHAIIRQEYKDIIIFSKTSKMIQQIADFIMSQTYSFPIKVVPFMGSDSEKKNDNWKAFNDVSPGVIKIIISTNLLESGANIPGLYTVIDTGIRFTMIYNNIQQQLIPSSMAISGSSRIQRMGRVGRDGPGIYLGLYKRERIFHEDDTNPILIKPDIFLTIFQYLYYLLLPIETVQDFMNKEVIVDLQEIDLIEQISADIILRSYYQLMRFGLIKKNGEMTMSLFLLIKQKYEGFIKFICQFHGCSPFETILIQYILQQPFKMDPKISLTPVQQFERICKYDYNAFNMDEIVNFYVYVYECVLEDKQYKNIPRNPEGYKDVFAIMQK